MRRINICIVGCRGTGKSTLTGRLLLRLGRFSSEDVNRCIGIARKIGRTGSEYAFLVDKLLEERIGGRSLISHMVKAAADGNILRIIDTPGYPHNIGETVLALNISEVALILASYEEIVEKSPTFRDLLRTVFIFGPGKIVPVINLKEKINEERFREVSEELRKILLDEKLLSRAVCDPIPVLAYEGLNLWNRDLEWYEGNPLLDVILNLKVYPLLKEPARAIVYNVTGEAGIPLVHMLRGSIKVGERILISPAMIIGKVVEAESWGERLSIVSWGVDAGLRLKGVARYHIKRGNLISKLEGAPMVSNRFETYIHLYHGKIKPGMTLAVQLIYETAQFRVLEITNKISGEGTVEGGLKGEAASVVVEADRDVAFDPVGYGLRTCRFMLRGGIPGRKGSWIIGYGDFIGVI